MNKANLFTEDNDFNICKSWLCGSTDGATWSIGEWWWNKIAECPYGVDREAYLDITDNCFGTQEFDDLVGYKYDYKMDDPKVDKEAQAMADRLNAYVEKVNKRIADLRERF